ncbi:hypothetical protein J1C56_08900 [Aminobacter anthyllidis]|uniref:Uncharacterized protein n=1 Tax=Aminobacter anthyllidis TaxID=1035067 RepID=A0A9X1A9E1_9HYPH|nr:hypothetical protein [Aminobacter anthyllidis]MBT1155708.1 hypothetical protein [Aminobacter anthyllidis]
MSNEQELHQLLAHWQAANQIALRTLVKLLVKNGALNPGQFEGTLEETIRLAGEGAGRADYQMLASLVKMIDLE